MTPKSILFPLFMLGMTSAVAGGPAGESDPTAQLANNPQPSKKKCVSQGQMRSGPSQAEMAKRAEEIRQIEEAKRRQHQIGTVHDVVTPLVPPGPGTIIDNGTPATTSTAGHATPPSQPQQQEKCQ